MTRPDLTIGLLWHSAVSDNLGVGALTVSQIAIVEKVAAEIGVGVRFVILGWRDPRPSYIEAPNVTRFEMSGRDLVSPGGLYSTVRGCDLVLDIGAGDSFADIYGPARIRKMLLGKFIVHAARRPMILSPQTIGPFTRAWAQKGALALDPAVPRGLHPRRAVDVVPARHRLHRHDRRGDRRGDAPAL